MEHSKFIVLLMTLNPEEVEKFKDFLNSPVFNKRKILPELFNEISVFYPSFNAQNFNKEYLFKQVYPGKPYSDELIRNMMSLLYRHLEKFISFINYEKDEFNQLYGLLTELNDRKQERLFRKKFKDIKDYLDNKAVINIDSMYRQHMLATINVIHHDYFRHLRMIEHDSEMNTILQEREEKLIEFFLADILNLYSSLINRMQINSERKYTLKMIKYINKYIEDNSAGFSQNFYLQIYFNMLMLQTEPAMEYYKNLRQLLNKHSGRLSHGERSKFYIIMHNYIQNRITDGDLDSIKEKYELYIESFKNEGMYNFNGSINNLGLITAVNYSLLVKDFDTASEFLDKYLNQVEEYYLESTRSLCKAMISYYRSDYNNTLKYLGQVHYDDLSYKLQVKTLSLMTNFSMEEIDGFYSAADSFKHFLSENKQITASYKTFYNNFINFSVKLFKAKDDLFKFDIKNFKKELIETTHIAKKHWLLENTDIIEKEMKNKV